MFICLILWAVGLKTEWVAFIALGMFGGAIFAAHQEKVQRKKDQ
jgi:uncharacterized membrane protein YphA (DoxX/SURF4 family)